MRPLVPVNRNARDESVGDRVRRLRLERGLTQRQLAAPGVSYAYISRIEGGGRQPSLKALRRLAPKLGVSVDYLETGVEGGPAAAWELQLTDAELKLRLASDTQAAEGALKRVLEEAVAANDLAIADRATAALGLAAAQRGDHDDVVRLLEGALASDRFTPRDRPDVFGTLARSYAAQGDTRRAAELLERCLADVNEQAPDDVPLQVRYATYLSYALSDLGELESAERVVREALARATDAIDPYTRVRLYWSLARLSEFEGKSGAALGYARRAIALLEATEDTLHLARAHLLSAWIVGSQGKDAREHLDQAERLLGPRPEAGDQALLRIEQARRAAIVGAATEAVARARQALDLLGSHHGGEQGAAWAALAQGLELQGEVEAADTAFRTAVDLLAENRRWQEAAQAARSWGRVLRSVNRESDALDAFERAADLAIRADARSRTSATQAH